MGFLSSYRQGILDKLITQTNRGDLAKLDRVKYEALITIHIHQVDIFNDIKKMGIKVAYILEKKPRILMIVRSKELEVPDKSCSFKDANDDFVTIQDSSDFEWMKQLRFYFKEEEDFTLCSITNVDFIYQVTPEI